MNAEDEARLGFSTRAVGGWRRVDDVGQSPLSPPIYQVATFGFGDMDDFASVAKSKISGGYLYTRWGNPTVDALARMVSSLEGAEGTACFSSGMAAIHGTLSALLNSGDHVVASTQLYGGTHGLLSSLFPRYGVETSKVAVGDHEQITAAFTDRTKILYCETLGNPTLDVADLEALSSIARARGALLVVDATFTPPCVLRPLEHGADIVIHSATKYLGGHFDLTAGVVSGSARYVDAIRMLSLDTGGVLA
ncbi:MAG TPA: aminotransferase class I/II-fold pyridoxal phosphate-dependent enzyme, partial [Actinomycetota bacterium]|nr:aminotransferase class I/II-fold pyridoxal phosphate-dependent enzyme [Actinomycetota bacterium]